jgi:hypothetical protein
MRRIVFYIEESGEIVDVADYLDEAGDDEIAADQPAGCVWIEGDADPDTDYVVAGAVAERPDFGAQDVYHVDADGVVRTLFTMPDPVTVTYKGEEYSAGDFLVDAGPGFVLGAGDDYLVFAFGSTDFDFASSRNGEFEFLIEPAFPAKATVVTVIADAV